MVEPIQTIDGHRVLVDKLAWRFRNPDRWETVAVTDLEDSSRWVVKRVVGLPGEDVEIRDGDVFIDGEIARKSHELRRAMATVVHDDRFRPTAPGRVRERWSPSIDPSGWTSTAAGYRFDGSKSHNTAMDAPDWLEYRHLAGFLPQPEREMPITDHSGYNQAVAREPNQVSDVYLTGTCTMSGRGTLSLRCFGDQTWTVRIVLADHTVQLFRDDTRVTTATEDTVWCKRHFEIGICDQSVFFRIDGRTVFQHAFEPTMPARSTSSPFAIGAHGLTAEIDDLVVSRDVFYTHPSRTKTPWRRGLASGEFLLLGDNSPVSDDGRHWDQATRSDDIVGRVVAGRAN